ncbi:hypothetical protein JCM30237_13120 [Halolamina litorea]|uniref:Major facilitator superfamily (MFS) profile domain-containing protein n=1 Tax=Halolamina litorea TaxID=1515593 RepID=A0ABD6BNE0_9EURY|nr:hypothetical protein [Halolamina litorea]
MSRRTQAGSVRERGAVGLLVGAAIALVIAYPPPSTGVDPLLGVGNVFVPLALSAVSVLTAGIGGALAGGVLADRVDAVPRLVVRTAVPAAALAIALLYLVVVAGFG